MYGDEAIDCMRTVKKVLDPYNLLGRGNIFD
jgi:FAD/FMN-containing dehydrogenase